MTAVEVRNLTVVADGYPIVRGLSLTAAPGEWVGFIAPPDQLTLLFQVLDGTVLPTEGEIWYYNEPPRRASERRLLEVVDSEQMLPSPAPILLLPHATKLPFPSLEQTILIGLPPSRLFIETIYKIFSNNYKLIDIHTSSREVHVE
ncbi:hypothetical protein HRbin17_02137 [bacterium HR17]|uniref:Uncharacterized protein n=1 Tax=Candidatus Fervidibacter japonicus TaxID=2035412 RepID=A0A2H5XEJ0_9BACT|nr:hypothetical protein HRbin17_02137 [bacterium HR17]